MAHDRCPVCGSRRSDSEQRNEQKGFDGDWDGVLYGRGCQPPKSIMPPRPIRIHFTDAEIEERLGKKKEVFHGRREDGNGKS